MVGVFDSAVLLLPTLDSLWHWRYEDFGRSARWLLSASLEILGDMYFLRFKDTFANDDSAQGTTYTAHRNPAI